MSTYTTELRYLIENDFDIGLQDYEIFDGWYRRKLNQKIINHYYFREIGLETAGKFKHFLNVRMNEIMPYYNKLYESELIKIEPLTRVDYSEEIENSKSHDSNRTTTDTRTESEEGVQNSNSNVNNTSNSTDTVLNSDTPSKKLQKQDLEEGFYATNTALNDREESEISTGNSNTTINNNKGSQSSLQDSNTYNEEENFLKKIFGNNAVRTDSEMIIEFRKTFLNIDMMIINELEDLFMTIY